MSTPRIRKQIEGSAFFAGLEPAWLDFLAQHAVERDLNAGEVLFNYGDRADRFYMVIDGEIRVEVPALEGPVLELQRLGPGAVVGWSWLIPPHTWSFQARAASTAAVLEIDGPAVLAKCESEPKFGYELLKRFSALMSERLNAARQKMMEAWQPPGFA